MANEFEKDITIPSWRELKEAEAKAEEERAKEAKEAWRKTKERKEAEDKEIGDLLKKAGDRIRERNITDYEETEEQAIAEAKQRVKSEYEEQGKIKSNKQKALENMARGLFNE